MTKDTSLPQNKSKNPNSQSKPQTKLPATKQSEKKNINTNATRAALLSKKKPAPESRGIMLNRYATTASTITYEDTQKTEESTQGVPLSAKYKPNKHFLGALSSAVLRAPQTPIQKPTLQNNMQTPDQSETKYPLNNLLPFPNALTPVHSSLGTENNPHETFPFEGREVQMNAPHPPTKEMEPDFGLISSPPDILDNLLTPKTAFENTLRQLFSPPSNPSQIDIKEEDQKNIAGFEDVGSRVGSIRQTLGSEDLVNLGTDAKETSPHESITEHNQDMAPLPLQNKIEQPLDQEYSSNKQPTPKENSSKNNAVKMNDAVGSPPSRHKVKSKIL